MRGRKSAERVTRYADRFAAIGAEPRLRIVQLLLSAHPQGLVVGAIQDEVGIPASTLSHHLDKLKNEDLVRVRRRSEEHTSELQSRPHLVCRLLLEKKKTHTALVILHSQEDYEVLTVTVPLL